MDKPGGNQGTSGDRDGNNGCGNDADFEDDNNGNCGGNGHGGNGGPDHENPVDETPVNENPGGEHPGGENPGGDQPGGEHPGGETPGYEPPVDETPDNQPPVYEGPGGGVPVYDPPGFDTPVYETPSGGTPNSEVPSSAPGSENPNSIVNPLVGGNGGNGGRGGNGGHGGHGGHGGDGSNFAPAIPGSSEINRVPGVSGGNLFDTDDTFAIVRTQGLDVVPDGNQSFDFLQSATRVSDQPTRSIEDVPDPVAADFAPVANVSALAMHVPATGADVVAPVVNASVSNVEGSVAPANAPVATMPAAGIGMESEFGSFGSLLLTISSGLAAVGGVITRRCQGDFD